MDLGIKYQGKILRLMTLGWEDPQFLVPHMQTALLKKMQQYSTAWTDLPIVEKELALRVVNYLVATAKPVGLILNFGERKIEVKRKNKNLKIRDQRDEKTIMSILFILSKK